MSQTEVNFLRSEKPNTVVKRFGDIPEYTFFEGDNGQRKGLFFKAYSSLIVFGNKGSDKPNHTSWSGPSFDMKFINYRPVTSMQMVYEVE